MRIIIAGGDGFIGWPLSMRLSNLGHQVLILDNFSRRTIDQQNGYSSLSNIKSLQERVRIWKEVTQKQIKFKKVDVASEKELLFQIFQNFSPQAVYHLAEQKSAPYSMKNLNTIAETFTNNTQTTLNILLAIMKVNPKCHLIHIGTMGVYGYGTIEGQEIPQGYCKAKMNCEHIEKCECPSVQIVHPYYPGSIYHMTKCIDNVALLNFQKFFNLKITELHQGIVWGISTQQCNLHPDLCTRLDVDSDFGTVLNRFCSQVACGHPITIYGTGEQTRAFINLNDSIQCLVLALKNGSQNNSQTMSILNQMTACHSINNLKDRLLQLYPEASFEYIQNPRVQKSKNSLQVKNQNFKILGFKGIHINQIYLRQLIETIRSSKQNFNKNLQYIKPISFWKFDSSN